MESNQHLKKALQFVIALLASIHLAGGPYALVQVVAWGNMLVSYSQADGLAKAAIDTFSGEKPCAMCCKIAEAKRDDAKKQLPGSPEAPASSKLHHELLPAESIGLKPPMAADFTVAVPLPPACVAGLGHAAPLLPPPRWV